MRSVRWALVALVALGCLALSAPAWATIVRHLTLERQVGLSDVVARARVVEAHSFRDGGKGPIMTLTTLEIERGLWGIKDGAKLKVLQAGGRVGELETVLPGDARLAAGERAVVLLKGPQASPAGPVYTFVALAQSRWAISGSGADAVVKRELGGLAFMQEDGRTMRTIEEPPRLLSSLEAELEALIAAVKGGAR